MSVQESLRTLDDVVKADVKVRVPASSCARRGCRASYARLDIQAEQCCSGVPTDALRSEDASRE